MTIAITGTSTGIGRAVALKFLDQGHNVVGFDIEESTIDLKNYTHIVHDIKNVPNFKEGLVPFDIIINNAGIQTDYTGAENLDIDTNLKGTIKFTEYFLKDKPTSVLFVGSVSAHTGSEFPEYVASKGGLIAYMKNVAMRATKWRGTCNSLDPGGVLTDLNQPVLENRELWNQIMKVTPLKRWATPEEIAEWAYFLTVTQSFCTGQSIVVDGGERDCNSTFVWPGWSI